MLPSPAIAVVPLTGTAKGSLTSTVLASAGVAGQGSGGPAAARGMAGGGSEGPAPGGDGPGRRSAEPAAPGDVTRGSGGRRAAPGYAPGRESSRPAARGDMPGGRSGGLAAAGDLPAGGPGAAGDVAGGMGRPVLGVAALAGGGCCSWPLPADATCAAVARGVFRDVAAALALPAELESDGMLMTSELAANTLHAHANIEFDGAGSWPIAGAPELWIYLRRRPAGAGAKRGGGNGAAGAWELVVKVFDSLSGWKADLAPVPGAAGADAVSGRGLGVVAGLSAGQWGHHLTRSRFGGWKVPGKAVWFAQPVPAGIVPGPLRRTRLAPGRAARALEEMLAERGLGDGLLRAQEPSDGMSVLSVRCGLTVWCRDSVIWWRSPDGRHAERVPTDLVEVAEQIVRACAEMDRAMVPTGCC